MELPCQRKFNPLASQGAKHSPIHLNRANRGCQFANWMATGWVWSVDFRRHRHQRWASMQVSSGNTSLALGSHWLVVIALGTGGRRRPGTERHHWIAWDYSKKNVKSLTTWLIELVRQTLILACASTYCEQSPPVPRNRVFFEVAKQHMSRHYQHQGLPYR